VEIEAQAISLREGGAINASTSGPGAGGDVRIQTGRLEAIGNSIQGEEPSGIYASSALEENGGRAGNISVSSEKLSLQDAYISTSSASADGGNIFLNVPGYIYLNRGEISTAVDAAQGDGGNITLSPGFIVLDNGRISANAYEGRGGNIDIHSRGFYVFGVSQFTPGAVEKYLEEAITASSERGVSGEIRIEIPELDDIGSGLTVLPGNFIDASALQQVPCTPQRAAEASKFIVTRYPGKKASPEDWRGGGCATSGEQP
jgi:large exoprotein involved in heme utilization and adhesion